MNITINIIEVATELAHKKLMEYSNNLNETDYKFEFPNGVEIEDEDEDEVRYTEEGQGVFDQFYDEYYDFLWNIKEVEV
mgnify:FL=1